MIKYINILMIKTRLDKLIKGEHQIRRSQDDTSKTQMEVTNRLRITVSRIVHGCRWIRFVLKIGWGSSHEKSNLNQELFHAVINKEGNPSNFFHRFTITDKKVDTITPFDEKCDKYLANHFQVFQD